MRPSTRLSLRFAAVALAAWVVAMDAASAQDNPRKYQIAEQSLDHALRELALASNLDLLFSPDLVAGKKSPSLDGKFTVDEALRTLLRGSGLEFSVSGSRVVISESKSAPTRQAIAPTTSTANGTNGDLHLAQAETDPSVQGVRSESQDSAGDNSSRASAEAEKNRIVLEEIVVTGTNLAGVRETAAPSMTIARREFELAGQTTVQEVFKDLPQNFSAVTMDGSIATNGTQLANAAFEEAVSAIDLRGLGPQSTLVLLNGQRRAGGLSGRVVDVSTIPLSAVDRIDIVTGGASAVYGSDAVGGIVNFVLRRTFDGAESQAYYGAASEDPASLQLSQTFGRRAARGGFIVTYDFSNSWPLDIAQTDLIAAPSISGNTPQQFYVTPDDRRHALYLAGEFQASDRAQLFWDGLYTRKKDTHVVDFGASGTEVNGLILGKNEQASASAGARLLLGQDWSLKVMGSHSRTETETRVEYAFNGVGTPVLREPSARVSSLGTILNGTLPGVLSRVDLAVGLEAREEFNDAPSVVSGSADVEATRDVRSAFVEASVPLVQGTRPGVEGLKLSVAGRYDDYSDFGSTFNPQAGIIWSPGAGLSFRGNYAEAFRAPELYALTQDLVMVVQRRPDPSAPGGRRPVATLTGGNGALQPEEATTWTFGVDYVPPFQPGTKLSVSYFDIDYQDRIDVSAQGLDPVFVLQRPQFASLLNPAPDAVGIDALLAQAALFQNVTGIPFGSCPAFGTCTTNGAALLSAYPNMTLFDNRVNNLATEKVRGLDLLVQSSVEMTWALVSLGLNSTYTLQHVRRVTAESAESTLIDDVGKPVRFRARGNVGLTRGAFGSHVYGNYVKAYANSTVTPRESISSWTTFDLSLQMDGSKLTQAGALRKIRATLGVNNVLDRDPPEFLQNAQGLRYDSANADPVGRFTFLRVVVSW